MPPTNDDIPPPHTDADYYGFFLLELRGVIEDARNAGWDPAGVDLLSRGRDRFLAEFAERWPGQPLPSAEAGAESEGCDGAFLLNALSGVEDSAVMSGYDHDGSEMLRRAIRIFIAELRSRGVEV